MKTCKECGSEVGNVYAVIEATGVAACVGCVGLIMGRQDRSIITDHDRVPMDKVLIRTDEANGNIVYSNVKPEPGYYFMNLATPTYDTCMGAFAKSSMQAWVNLIRGEDD